MRPGELDDVSVVGVPSPDPTGALVDAFTYIDTIHRQPCRHRGVRLLFKRLPTYGISNDLNSLVRSLAVALRDRHQLVLLPPSARERAKVRHLAGELNVKRPWHWLEDGIPLESLIYPSACQRELEMSHPTALDALGANNTAVEQLVSSVGLAHFSARCRDYDSRNRWNLDLAPRVIPDRFRSYGMLWWMQVLTTYLIRVRAPLANRIRLHPSLSSFTQAASASHAAMAVTFSSPGVALGGPVWASTPNGLNPTFDVGLHVRMGDACGMRARRSAFRRCVRSLKDAFDQLASHGVRGGRVFLASDSQEIIEQASHVRVLYPHFNVSFLPLDRRKYGRVDKLVELSLPREGSETLTEALIDLFLLSRARLIAGSMLGNIPRLALQLRVRPPAATKQPYVSLDGHRWCTTSSCKPYSLESTKRSRTSEHGRRRRLPPTLAKLNTTLAIPLKHRHTVTHQTHTG